MKIRFVWGYDPLSLLIRAGEHDGDCPTHAEAVLVDGTLLGAHFDGGVQIRPKGYDASPVTASPLRDLVVVIDTAPAQEAAWLTFLQTQVGKPYDSTAIAGIALNRDWREDDSWMCSELMTAALESCGYLPRLSAADNHISPRDLLLVLSGRIAIPNAA